MSIQTWLNSKRLRDYPRLVFIASWLVLFLNFIFHNGWIGGLTGILIGGDFISNYSGGILYQTDIQHLYDSSAQEATQTSLVYPSKSPGFAPFISPPNVAFSMGLMTKIELPYALLGWELVNILCVLLSVHLIYKYILPAQLFHKGFTPIQLGIIILSSFAFVDGFLAGQSHGITLLLCTGIIVAMMNERWGIAGVLGSFLTYKPQFVIGFLICWIIWVKFRAILSFGILTFIGQLPVLISHGFSPYFEYLNFAKTLLYLPYAKDSFPVSVMATPYALLTTLFPLSFAKAFQIGLLLLEIAMVALFSYWAYRERDVPAANRVITYSFALLLPLLIAPHTLIYDLLILVPGLILLARIREITPTIKYISITIYICLLFLPLLGYLIKVALPGIIPLSLFIYLLAIYFRKKITLVLS